jgi:hypothetical protein
LRTKNWMISENSCAGACADSAPLSVRRNSPLKCSTSSDGNSYSLMTLLYRKISSALERFGLGHPDGPMLLSVLKHQQRRAQERRMHKIGMVIGNEAEGDRGIILPRGFSRGHMQCDQRHNAGISSESRWVAHLCTRLRVAACLCVRMQFFWSGVDVALM